KSFVLYMIKDPNDAQIVRSTIELAHGLGLKVIAEGVENSEVWQRLRDFGCDEAQGYYMSRPYPQLKSQNGLIDSHTGRLAHSRSCRGCALADVAIHRALGSA
ncbi:MAG TPA: EAL domain-containing protein, partial [Candidatus Binatia bacterium]|nr:EAL domain-containing protein [Candidatus Binatia bacterium]